MVNFKYLNMELIPEHGQLKYSVETVWLMVIRPLHLGDCSANGNECMHGAS